MPNCKKILNCESTNRLRESPVDSFNACSVPRPLPVLASHVDEVRDVVAAVQQGTVHEVLRVLDEHLQSGRGQDDGDGEAAGHLLEYLGAGGGDDGVGAAVPAHDAPAQPAHLLPVLLHPLPVGRQVIRHCSTFIYL